MKRFLIFLPLLIGYISLAQPCTGYLGTKTLYPAPTKKYTPAPAGFEPVFINHVGRHGARHLTKDVAASFAYQLLGKAESANALTPEGRRLKEMVWMLERVEKKDFESISYEGRKEQEQIARRMVANYPSLFTSESFPSQVTVAKKIRTWQTADAFLNGLADKVNVASVRKVVDDTIMRFYDLSPAYLEFEKSLEWQQQFAAFKKSTDAHKVAMVFTKQMFQTAFFKNLSQDESEKFADDIFGFATIINSIQKEIADHGYTPQLLDFTRFFTCGQLQILGAANEAEDFLLKGPGTNASGIQVKIAAPLLLDFINTTDQFIREKRPSAQFRFTHAEAIAPFAALLSLSGSAKPTSDIKELNKIWNASNVIPLSANVQWLLYRNPATNEYLVKLLHNENEVAIEGLTTKNFPYYRWDDVKNFYLKKLNGFGATQDKNGFLYLQGVK